MATSSVSSSAANARLPGPPPGPIPPGTLRPLVDISPVAPLTFLDALMAPAPAFEVLQPSTQVSRPRLKSVVSVPAVAERRPIPEPAAAFNDIEDGWKLVGGRGRPRPAARRSTPMSQYKELLFRRARGKCFKCFSPEHRVANCHNLPKCLLCGEPGHKARWCKAEQEKEWRRKGEKERRRDTAAGDAASLRAQGPSSSRVPEKVSATATGKMMNMEAPAGDADFRPAMVYAAAPRTAAIAGAERRLVARGVVAVAVGRCPDLELADVGRLIARHFDMPDTMVEVTMRARGEFLLMFETVAARNVAVQWRGAVNSGPASFMLSPWTRFRRARAGKMCYKARVCIQGVPEDAHQVETIRGLFSATDIIDGIDESRNSKEDSACCKVWVWMANLTTLARRGQLDLEEPIEVDSPLQHFPSLGVEAEPVFRSGPLKTLQYDVILHLDRVLDYSGSPSPPDTGSPCSMDSGVSGIPSPPSMSYDFPVTWRYTWNLDYEAGTFPPRPPRVSAHARLRYPDGWDGDGGAGGGAGGEGRRRGGGAADRGGGRGSQPEQRFFPVNSSSMGGAHGGYHRQLAGLTVGPVGPAVGSLSLEATEDREPGSGKEVQVEASLPLDENLHTGPVQVACMPLLLVPEACAGQTADDRKEKVVEGLDEAMIVVHGHAGQEGQSGRSRTELLDCEGTVGPLTMSQNLGGSHEDLLHEKGLLFGPHSPKEKVDSLVHPGPTCSRSGRQEGEPITGLNVERSMSDTLASFLIEVAAPVVQPLLFSPPSPAKNSDGGADLERVKETKEIKRSGRLAAKPTAGWTAMEKVQLVLLKKTGEIADETTATPADLAKYRQMYTKTVPPGFILAVTDLVKEGGGGSIKPVGLGIPA